MKTFMTGSEIRNLSECEIDLINLSESEIDRISGGIVGGHQRTVPSG
jgi:hypothetical protein